MGRGRAARGCGRALVLDSQCGGAQLGRRAAAPSGDDEAASDSRNRR